MPIFSPRTILLLAIGALLLLGGIAAKDALALKEPSDVKGEDLDLVNWLFYEYGDYSYAIGPYLGTFAAGWSHCGELRGDPNGVLNCVNSSNQPANVQSSGFGLLYLVYYSPCPTCAVTPQIRMSIKFDSGQGMRWYNFKVIGASGEVGHEWNSGECRHLEDLGKNVDLLIADSNNANEMKSTTHLSPVAAAAVANRAQAQELVLTQISPHCTKEDLKAGQDVFKGETTVAEDFLELKL